MLFNDKVSLLRKYHVTMVWFESTTEAPVEVHVFLKAPWIVFEGTSYIY